MKRKRPVTGKVHAAVTGVVERMPSKEKWSNAQKQGKLYEKRALAKIAEAGQLTRNPWIEFLDDEGWRLCQPDGVLEVDGQTIVLEMKLRQREAAYDELLGLYMPVVERWMKDDVAGLVVCRALAPDMPEVPLFCGADASIDLPAGGVGTWLLPV